MIDVINNIQWLNVFIQPEKRVFWLYLLSSGLIAVWVLRKQGFDKHAMKIAASTMLERLPGSIAIDSGWLMLNSLLRKTLVVPILGSQLSLALLINQSLYAYLGEGDFLLLPALWQAGLLTVVLFVVEDFSRFIWHLAYHKIPLLWRFHAIHHSAEVLTPLTLYRVHSVEMFLNSCRSVLVVGVLMGLYSYCFAGSLQQWQLLGVGLFNVLFNFAAANLRHSPIWLGFGVLEKYFISPAQHQIHHSCLEQHLDKNFGSCLALWDRCYGSWLASGKTPAQRFGLLGGGPASWRAHIVGIKN